MSKFVKVATIDEMTEKPVTCIEVEGQKIVLFDVQGEIFALSDRCPHRGGPLSEGELEGTTVICPWHGAQFDVRTGAILGPPATVGVKSYAVKVTGKDIVIEI